VLVVPDRRRAVDHAAGDGLCAAQSGERHDPDVSRSAGVSERLIAGGTRLSTLANGVIGFGLFGMAFIGAFIEQIGGVMQQFGNSGGETAANIGKIVALVMPSETLWRRAVADMPRAWSTR